MEGKEVKHFKCLFCFAVSMVLFPSNVIQERSKLERTVQRERSKSSSLRKELSWYRRQPGMALQAQKETTKKQEKPDTLSSIQTVIQGKTSKRKTLYNLINTNKVR